MLLENVAAWSERIGDRLNDLPDEERRELLQSLLDRVTIDRDNNLNLTLAVPTEEFVSIKRPVSGSGSWDRIRSVCGAYANGSGADSAESATG